MANKSSDLLRDLSSVGKLLDKPQVRLLVEQWSRSPMADGVRSFLDELRHDVEQSASDFGMPSIRELAEQAATRLLQRQPPTLRPAINATGQFHTATWASRPLADVALEQMVSLGREFVADPLRRGGQSTTDVAKLLCQKTGAEAAAVLHSYSGALWLTLAAVARGGEVLVSRGEAGDLDPGCPLAPLVSMSGSPLIEVGSTNRTSALDYESAIGERSTALLKIHPEHYQVTGDTESTPSEALVALARDRSLIFIEALGTVSLHANLAADADLVLVRGDGLIGGPPCGILLGRGELVDRVLQHPMHAAWQLNPLSACALEASLRLEDSSQHVGQGVPLRQLLDAPLENLKNRALRLAPQLAPTEWIAAAEAIPVESQFDSPRPQKQATASYAIALTPAPEAPAEGSLERLDVHLRSAVPPVIGRICGDRLLLDLRTVFPRQDGPLVESIVERRATDRVT